MTHEMRGPMHQVAFPSDSAVGASRNFSHHDYVIIYTLSSQWQGRWKAGRRDAKALRSLL
jgi:hypothetical protein